jgi:hypothetical protein
MTPEQQRRVKIGFGRFAVAARRGGVSDQALAEWLLDLATRWLAAHGVAATNIHLWVTHALERRFPAPLSAAARAPNDFGGQR